MKRVAIGDLHISGFQTDRLDDQGLPYRLGLIIKSLDQIALECRRRGITHADILGDIINDKSIIYTVAYDALKDFLNRYPDITFTMITGNHDLSATGENQKSAVAAFSNFPNVKTYLYKPEVVDNITYVPWTHSFMEEIHKLPATDILIAHLGLNEAALQSGMSKIDKISIKDLSKYKLVLLGHYHRPQVLSNEKTRVYYPGSIIHKDWNDKGEKKRFLVYDTQTLEVEEVFLTGFCEYREYVINKDDDMASIIELVKKDAADGHHVRVKNKTDQKIQDKINDVLILESQNVDITNRGINVSQTKDEQAKKYLEIKGIPENERDLYFQTLHKYEIFHV